MAVLRRQNILTEAPLPRARWPPRRIPTNDIVVHSLAESSHGRPPIATGRQPEEHRAGKTPHPMPNLDAPLTAPKNPPPTPTRPYRPTSEPHPPSSVRTVTPVTPTPNLNNHENKDTSNPSRHLLTYGVPLPPVKVTMRRKLTPSQPHSNTPQPNLNIPPTK